MFAPLNTEFLPGVVGRQVKFAGAAGNAGAAAQAFEPVVLAQFLAQFARGIGQVEQAFFELLEQALQDFGGDGRVAAVGGHGLALAVQVFENVGFEVRSAADVEDFKQRDQGEMVVQRVIALLQRKEAGKQMLQTQIGANFFVKRIFVQNHAQFSSGGIISLSRGATGAIAP